MEKNVVSEINNGLETAFINSTIDSNLAYRPQFITNRQFTLMRFPEREFFNQLTVQELMM